MAHCHHHHPSSSDSPWRLWVVLFLSLTYMVAEIVGGWASGSLALLADAGHMGIDVAALVLGLFALWIAKKPATASKSFGYHRAEILAALVNGTTLVGVSIWILYEAWERLHHPTEVRGPLMMAVAGGGLAVNAIAIWLLRPGTKTNLNVRGMWLHLLSDLFGSVSAIAAAFFVWRYQWSLADPIVSSFLAVLILYGAWKLVVECVNVLLEGTPAGVDVGQIRNDLLGLSGVVDVHDLHVWTLASGVPSMSAHVRTKAGSDPAEVLRRVTELLRSAYYIEHVTIQLEPPDFNHREMHA